MLYDGQEGLGEMLKEAVEGLEDAGFVEGPMKKNAKKATKQYEPFW